MKSSKQKHTHRYSIERLYALHAYIHQKIWFPIIIVVLSVLPAVIWIVILANFFRQDEDHDMQLLFRKLMSNIPASIVSVLTSAALHVFVTKWMHYQWPPMRPVSSECASCLPFAAQVRMWIIAIASAGIQNAISIPTGLARSPVLNAACHLSLYFTIFYFFVVQCHGDRPHVLVFSRLITMAFSLWLQSVLFFVLLVILRALVLHSSIARIANLLVIVRFLMEGIYSFGIKYMVRWTHCPHDLVATLMACSVRFSFGFLSFQVALEHPDPVMNLVALAINFVSDLILCGWQYYRVHVLARKHMNALAQWTQPMISLDAGMVETAMVLVQRVDQLDPEVLSKKRVVFPRVNNVQTSPRRGPGARVTTEPTPAPSPAAQAAGLVTTIVVSEARALAAQVQLAALMTKTLLGASAPPPASNRHYGHVEQHIVATDMAYAPPTQHAMPPGYAQPYGAYQHAQHPVDYAPQPSYQPQPVVAAPKTPSSSFFSVQNMTNQAQKLTSDLQIVASTVKKKGLVGAATSVFDRKPPAPSQSMNAAGSLTPTSTMHAMNHPPPATVIHYLPPAAMEPVPVAAYHPPAVVVPQEMVAPHVLIPAPVPPPPMESPPDSGIKTLQSKLLAQQLALLCASEKAILMAFTTVIASFCTTVILLNDLSSSTKSEFALAIAIALIVYTIVAITAFLLALCFLPPLVRHSALDQFSFALIHQRTAIQLQLLLWIYCVLTLKASLVD